MAVNCIDLGYSFELGDFCLPVELKIENEESAIDKAWVIGGIFIGLLVGVGLTGLCVRPFLKARIKWKKQAKERSLFTATIIADHLINKSQKTLDGCNENFKDKTNIYHFSEKNNNKEATNDGKQTELSETLFHGIVDIITKKTGHEVELEIANQHMASISVIDLNEDQEKDVVLLCSLECMLRQKVAKRVIDENFCNNFLMKAEQDLKDLRQSLVRELGDHFLVEGIMFKYVLHLSNLERKLGMERIRQHKVLQQSIADRKLIVEQYYELEKQQADTRCLRVALFEEVICERVKDGQLMEKHQTEFCDQYKNSLDDLYDTLNTEKVEEWKNICDQSRCNRLMKIRTLMEEQGKEQALFLKGVKESCFLKDYIKEYHNLICRQHIDQEQLNFRLDSRDLLKIEQLRLDFESKEDNISCDLFDNAVKNIMVLSDISPAECKHLLQKFKNNLLQHKGQLQQQRKVMSLSYQEAIPQQRQQQRDTALLPVEAGNTPELQLVINERTQVLHQVLSGDVGLLEKDKESILQHHERNMMELSSHLHRRKMRLQKSLEIKAIQRKVPRLEMKKRKSVQPSGRDLCNKGGARFVLEPSEKVAAAEKSVKGAKRHAELHELIAAETTECLSVLDEVIKRIIARLQVGEARRKATNRNQVVTLKELQDQLDQKVSQLELVPSSAMGKRLQQYCMQAEQLYHTVQHQQEANELHLDKEILEWKKEKEFFASLAFMQHLLDQRYRKAMVELEKESMIKLQRAKDEMSRVLEAELVAKIMCQQRSLLAQLEAVSEMPDNSRDSISAA